MRCLRQVRQNRDIAVTIQAIRKAAFFLFFALSGSVAAYELSIAHINDHHSNMRPFSATLMIDGEPIRVSLGGFAHVATAFGELEQREPNLLKIHAGDAITGTPYYKFFKGQSDARAMNVVCFDALAIGNHEFDAGDQGLRVFLDELRAAPECDTPVLSANVHPAEGTPLAFAPDGQPYLAPYAIKEIGGVKIGLVGITVVGKTQNASRPLASTEFEDEAKAAQRTIDELRQKGINHIVLVTHVGFDDDLLLAAQLRGVDVIVGGDSHTLVGDFSEIGLSGKSSYPTVMRDRDGRLVCVGQAWEYAKAIGLMKVTFDDAGNVISCAGQASIVLGQSMQRKGTDGKWVNMSEDEIRTLVTKLHNPGLIKRLAPDADVLAALAPFEEQYDAQTSKPIGILSKDQSLCLTRVPGSANRGTAVCADVSERAGGADVAQVVAESFRLAPAHGPADIGIVNAGGVRTPIETNGSQDLILTYGTAFTLQPFPNELYIAHLTGQQIWDTLEEAVSNWKDEGNSDGSHPYASGLRWALDFTKPRGQRFGNLERKDHASGQWQSLDLQATYSVVLADYLTQGFEGFKTPGNFCKTASADQCMTAGGTFADESFIQYVTERQAQGVPLARPACSEYSHQKVTLSDGRQLKPCQ